MEAISQVKSVAPQTGNMNPQMGEANKKMIESRLNTKEDKLTKDLIKLVCPQAKKILSTCVVRSKEDASLRGSEMVLMYEVALEDGSFFSSTVNVASKGSIGLGSLNQLSIFWLDKLLSQQELQSNVGQALTMICGANNVNEKPKSPIPAGNLVTGNLAAKFGFPLQMWLGDRANLERFIFKGLNVMPGDLGKSVLLLNMRSAGLNGEDMFVMVDAGSLGEVMVEEAIQETTKKQKFVRIGSTDSMISFSRAMSLKRVGGANARGNGASQMQLIVKPRGLIDLITNPKNGKKVKATLALEKPTQASININKMNPNKVMDDDDEDYVGKQTEALLKRFEMSAVDFDLVEME